MFNLQITLSQFCSRNEQYQQLSQQTIVIVRFSNIKFDIRITFDGQNYIGGKKVLIDMDHDTLKAVSSKYSFGMFFQNSNGKFFSLISLQKLNLQDVISAQQIYFTNDFQQQVYQANLTLSFISIKNPRMPANKQKLADQKKFDQYFEKPAVPSNKVLATTLSSFLYGNKGLNQTKKSQPSKANKNQQKSSARQTLSKTRGLTQNWKKKPTSDYIEPTSNKPISNNIIKDYSDDQADDNPPVMQFTNTEQTTKDKLKLLRSELAQLNVTSPQFIKFETANQSKQIILKKNNFITTQNLTKKVNQKLDKMGKSNLNQKSLIKLNQKIDYQELRKKAKQQFQNYQGQQNVKIPVLRNGQYQFIDLIDVSQQQILKYAKKQKQLQQQVTQKQVISKKLQNKQKQNQILKKKLQQKQRLLQKQLLESKKKQLQLIKKHQQAQKYQSQKYSTPISQQDQDQNPVQSDKKSNDSQSNDKQSDDQYSSDFQQLSHVDSRKKSRISLESVKKQQTSFNDSYDPDFQSYSQSLLASQKMSSLSQIRETFKNTNKKY